jgi:hypothetical protein
MANIIIRRYEHYNRALGKYISCRKQYDEEMKKGGFVSYEKGCELAEKAKENLHKDYKELSPKALGIIKSARLMSDSKGNIKPSDKLIDGMKEVGVRFDVPDWLPKHYKEI